MLHVHVLLLCDRSRIFENKSGARIELEWSDGRDLLATWRGLGWPMGVEYGAQVGGTTITLRNPQNLDFGSKIDQKSLKAYHLPVKKENEQNTK